MAQWLERSANTQIWFSAEIGRPTEDVLVLPECWRRWSESTAPKLSPLLFEEAIKDRRQSLVNWIEGAGEHPFVVVADSPDEALAFLALALRETDGKAGLLHDRAILATSPEALARIAAASHEAILLVADRETELAAASLTRRHKVIVTHSSVSPQAQEIRQAATRKMMPACKASAICSAQMVALTPALELSASRAFELRKLGGLSAKQLTSLLALPLSLRAFCDT
ncbi:hypothetical protein GRI39_01220 [Altererythrobacter indicus]|uniref:Uncharacterized protein n=1 Tax=Altericroceibacterium indicum TaxID=374177 RepID=A0A845A7X1_9SPHN|nr:hypothetical protein [Altericroceibacterium indicum]MXP24666.1 hypothetical protein [Altericroceibacterium indicum]